MAEEVEPEKPSTQGEVPLEEERREEAPAEVIEIKVPKPFEDALEPFIDIYMEKRGLTDRKQAAVKLSRALAAMGYNPQREIQNVTTYINNLATVMDALPNTEETIPVKGSLLARSATEADRLLRRGHFGAGTDELDDMKELMRFANRARVTMRMLDHAFTGGETEMESKTVSDLKSRIERMEKEREFDAALTPIKQQLAALQETIKQLGEKPKTAEESGALKEVRESVEKINDRLDKKEERDSLTEAMTGIRDDLKGLGEKLKTGGGKGAEDIGDVFDQAITLLDKIKEVTVKHAGGGEGEIDWKTTAITTFGEIGTETIKAARDIMTGKEGEEEEEKKTTEVKESVSERIVDRKLLNYIRERVAAGAQDINTKTAAKDLGLSPKQVLAAYNRLEEKGLVTTPEATKTKGPESGESEPEKWVED